MNQSDFNWKNPDYDATWKDRSERLNRLRLNPELLLGVKEHYRNNPVDFINDFGVTFDPRLAEIGLETIVPFLLFDKQAEFINWIVDRWKDRQDGLVEKSRDMGVSWLCVAVACWMWLFHPGVVIGFGSRKEEYVDKLGDPKSLFWKIRAFINLLPKEFTPVGYIEKKHATYMNIQNPESGSVIVGEAGDNIGRGARTSIYFKDESAFLSHPESVDAALSQTSNCKIDVSTPNGNGNPFYRKRHGGKIPVFTFHWTQDPRKDEDWYAKQVATLDPVVLAQEIDIDYNASATDCWIDGNLVEAAQKIGPADTYVNGPWVLGIDAAHMGDDESIIARRRGLLSLPLIGARKVDGPILAGRVLDECRVLVKAGGQIGAIIIELDGPGVSCYDVLKRSEFADVVFGIHTGAQVSDDQNYNIRAQMWRNALEYLKVGGCSIARDPELKSQLSSLKYGYKNGLLLMEDKKQYKKRMGKSPDRADAWVLTHATPPKKKKPKVPMVQPFRQSVPGMGY